MAWTTPRTWVDGELVSATAFNMDLRDNQNHLFPFPESNNVRIQAFNAGRFTGTGSLVWTVESGDVLEDVYDIQGTELMYSIRLAATTLSGTTSNITRILMPDELRATEYSVMKAGFSTEANVYLQLNPTATQIEVVNANGNYTLVADGFWVYVGLIAQVSR